MEELIDSEAILSQRESHIRSAGTHRIDQGRYMLWSQIQEIRIYGDYIVSFRHADTGKDGFCFASVFLEMDLCQSRVLELGEYLPGIVGRAVIYHYDLMQIGTL